MMSKASFEYKHKVFSEDELEKYIAGLHEDIGLLLSELGKEEDNEIYFTDPDQTFMISAGNNLVTVSIFEGEDVGERVYVSVLKPKQLITYTQGPWENRIRIITDSIKIKKLLDNI
jgi:hypothetical protein